MGEMERMAEVPAPGWGDPVTGRVLIKMKTQGENQGSLWDLQSLGRVWGPHGDPQEAAGV